MKNHYNQYFRLNLLNGYPVINIFNILFCIYFKLNEKKIKKKGVEIYDKPQMKKPVKGKKRWTKLPEFIDFVN